MKKKFFVKPKDKKDWIAFTKKMDDIPIKESDFSTSNIPKKNKKIDLHGLSLDNANKEVKKFIINAFDNGYEKLLIVTGKGLRSKFQENPYVSDKLSVLKHSVPEYIKNNGELIDKISKISRADQKDGGDGALYIHLKKNKNL